MQMKEALVREAWAPGSGPDFAGLLADNFNKYGCGSSADEMTTYPLSKGSFSL